MARFCFGLFFFLTFCFSGAFEISACDCSGRTPGIKGIQTCGYYWYSEAVFTGLAEKISIENGQMRVTFAVEKPIRGVKEKTVDVFTSASEASCGYPFKQGERYFVYARKSGNGQLGESLCGPTTLLKDAKDDIEYVAELERGKFGSRLFGAVTEDRQKSYYDKRTFEKLAGIEITAKGENGKNAKFKTRTDENGFYVFKDIPADTYRVTAKIPQGLREIATREDLLVHWAVIYKDGIRCDGESFVVTRQGSIRGKVIGQDGKNPVQQKLFLVPLNEGGASLPYNWNWPAEKWANRENGEYVFNVVPAGKYLLIINPQNCPYPTNGFPTMFFPGVADRPASRIISVGDGANLKLDDFRILPMLNERWFAGTVLFADRIPAANVTVRLLDGDRSKCQNFHSEVVTDELGRFRIKGYENYDYQVDANLRSDGTKGYKQLYSKPVSIRHDDTSDSIELVLDINY